MSASTPNPVSIFYSYSRKDAQHRKKLEEALSPLRHRGLIREWYDGEIVPGQDWNAEIIRQLESADVILMLISNSFLNSDFAWNVESKVALERVRKNEAIVIAIIVKDAQWEKLEFSRLQVLPPGGKPVNRWSPVDRGWKEVCDGIERAIRYLAGPRPVNDVLRGCKDVVVDAASKAKHANGATRRGSKRFASVAEFWEQRSQRLDGLDRATVRGTFSQFAPVLIGPPAAKRRLHKEFRQALERDSPLLTRKRATLDACLSVSAGQMVWRLNRVDDKPTMFGLYNSIVRNSIPVLVTHDYYDNNLEREFRKANIRKTFEATVCGRVVEIDNTSIRDLFRRNDVDQYISPVVVEDLCSHVFALLVDGAGTSIERDEPARYLDGDIWIAAEAGGQERFFTTFLDVANPDERRDELYQLEQRLRQSSTNYRRLTQYDEVEELELRERQTLPKNPSQKNAFLERVLEYGFGA